jgi:hypothetical protein
MKKEKKSELPLLPDRIPLTPPGYVYQVMFIKAIRIGLWCMFMIGCGTLTPIEQNLRCVESNTRVCDEFYGEDRHNQKYKENCIIAGEEWCRKKYLEGEDSFGVYQPNEFLDAPYRFDGL